MKKVAAILGGAICLFFSVAVAVMCAALTAITYDNARGTSAAPDPHPVSQFDFAQPIFGAGFATTLVAVAMVFFVWLVAETLARWAGGKPMRKVAIALAISSGVVVFSGFLLATYEYYTKYASFIYVE